MVKVTSKIIEKIFERKFKDSENKMGGQPLYQSTQSFQHKPGIGVSTFLFNRFIGFIFFMILFLMYGVNYIGNLFELVLKIGNINFGGLYGTQETIASWSGEGVVYLIAYGIMILIPVVIITAFVSKHSQIEENVLKEIKLFLIFSLILIVGFGVLTNPPEGDDRGTVQIISDNIEEGTKTPLDHLWCVISTFDTAKCAEEQKQTEDAKTISNSIISLSYLNPDSEITLSKKEEGYDTTLKITSTEDLVFEKISCYTSKSSVPYYDNILQETINTGGSELHKDLKCKNLGSVPTQEETIVDLTTSLTYLLETTYTREIPIVDCKNSEVKDYLEKNPPKTCDKLTIEDLPKIDNKFKKLKLKRTNTAFDVKLKHDDFFLLLVNSENTKTLKTQLIISPGTVFRGGNFKNGTFSITSFGPFEESNEEFKFNLKNDELIVKLDLIQKKQDLTITSPIITQEIQFKTLTRIEKKATFEDITLTASHLASEELVS